MASPALAAAVPVNGTVGVAILPVVPVDPGTLTPPFTLAIAPALPSGLQFDELTGVISGTPVVASAASTHTVTATDGASAVLATSDVTVTIEGVVTPPSDISTGFGQPITGSPTATVAGLGAGVTWALSGGPGWLEISALGVISGTPTASFATAPITVTATDTAGARATGSFNLTVLDTLSPPTQSVSGVVGTPMSSSSALTSGATGVYSVVQDLAGLTGLSFDQATGVISGTPSKPIGPTPFTVQLTPTGGGSPLQATVTVTVDAVLGSTAQAVTGTVGTTIVSFIGYGSAAATSLGLVAPFAYSTVPGLPGLTSPGDLTINPTTGAITGRPTSAAVGVKYTVSVTDSKGAKASGPIVVNIAGLIAPTTQSVVGSVSSTMTTRAFTASGMTAPVTYAISQAPQTGLTFNAATGVVSGIPRVTQTSTVYEVTATDANGAKASAKVAITVGKAVLSPPVIGSVIGGPKVGSLLVFFTQPVLAPMNQSYTVDVYDALGIDLITSVTSTTSPVTVEGLVPGETYQVVVVANASASFDRAESAPKSGIAADAATAAATAAATGTTTTSRPSAATVGIATTNASALSRGGIVLATGTLVSSAKRLVVRKAPHLQLKKAPIARTTVNTYSRLYLRKAKLTGRVQVKIRLAGAWVDLGSATVTKSGRLTLPAFAAHNAGTFSIRLVPSSGKSRYVKLRVKAAAAGA